MLKELAKRIVDEMRLTSNIVDALIRTVRVYPGGQREIDWKMDNIQFA